MDENQKYYIPRYLDEPMRMILWTWDEVCVFLLPMVLLYSLTNQLLIGIILGLSAFIGLKKLKGDQAQNFLMTFAYWYLPPLIVFRKTPPSYVREYIG